MNSLEADLERARSLSVDSIADAIEAIGFECTRCGACCKAIDCEGGGNAAASEGNHSISSQADHLTSAREDHTATVFPDEIRRLQERGYDWRDVARPMPYGLDETDGGGETFEWALQTDACGDCIFYEEGDEGRCTVHEDRPLICQTYPFSVALDGTSQPMGEAVDEAGIVRAHECEGLGRDISRERAEELAGTLKERTLRELTEAIGVRDAYEPTDADGVVVYDSEGSKRSDGTPIGDDDRSDGQ